jgi:flagellar FliL protein
MADDKSKAAEGEAPKKSKKMLIMIIVAVVLLGGGLGGGYFMFGSSKKPATKPEPVAGAVIALDAITINLQDGHFLKLKLSLQATAAAGTETVDGSKALDAAINLFSNRSLGELSSNEARNKAKEQLKELVVKAYYNKETKEEIIMDVFYTEFVMQ